MLSVSPAIAPTSNRCGRFGPATAHGFGGSGDALTIAGGRREGEKIGRSRVALSELTGIFHNGFPGFGRAARLSELPGLSGVPLRSAVFRSDFEGGTVWSAWTAAVVSCAQVGA